MSSLYDPKFSVASASHQTCASRYFSVGSSVASARPGRGVEKLLLLLVADLNDRDVGEARLPVVRD